MSAPTRPGRRLPRRVYWVRRVVVLVGAVLALSLTVGLVVGVARLLDGGLGAADGGPQRASQVAATVTETPSATAGEPTAGPATAPSRRDRAERRRLAQPTGACEDSDVVLTPKVADAHAGSPVRIVLQVTTRRSAACTWEVSPETVFLTITSEGPTLWSSQQCPAAVPTASVVPRRTHADRVALVWDGRESDAECTGTGPWVLPGVYTATAAARGSVTVTDVGFLLGGAVAATRTAAPTPTPSPEGVAPSTGAGATEPDEPTRAERRAVRQEERRQERRQERRAEQRER